MATELDNRFRTRAERMDLRIDSCAAGMSTIDMIAIVRDIYGIDLSAVPTSAGQLATHDAIEAYLAGRNYKTTGPEVRVMINETFGINLDALSALEGGRISLFSKGQWILRQESDLFIVDTGTGDVDVTISPTSCFTETTGERALPSELANALIGLGYSYDADKGSCYYCNPSGEAVPDAFKGRTIAAIAQTIKQACSHL